MGLFWFSETFAKPPSMAYFCVVRYLKIYLTICYLFFFCATSPWVVSISSFCGGLWKFFSLDNFCWNLIIAVSCLDEKARIIKKSGNSSVGRAQPCQGWGREFETRFPLHLPTAGWQSGYAAACKAVDIGSIPFPASIPLSNVEPPSLDA